MLTSICYMGFKNNNGLLLYSKNSLIKFEIGDDHIPRQKSHPSQKYPDGRRDFIRIVKFHSSIYLRQVPISVSVQTLSA